ncbi:DUF3883 domain-containing protein [Arthrobacter sp. BHU FT2]|nr:DUF3883 domain-containing protein [Arthrobacter sp. BHU FT2]
MIFEPNMRVRVPHRKDLQGYVRIELATQTDDGWILFVEQGPSSFAKVDLTAAQAAVCEVLFEDGSADSCALLAGLWTAWMRAVGAGAKSTVLAGSTLRPYAHQMNAVYGAMLPQPRLRFLLADEPGTGKTIMAGLYLREMQRLGFIRNALVVVPAHLVSKWQADFERFLGGGLRAITAQTVREHALEGRHDLWVVSLDLLAVNPAVQNAVHPDRMGWDAVVFDEAHRLTPTAASYYQAAEMLARHVPRALLMTATPHRGKEWLFRALLHLVDPDVYPPASDDEGPVLNVKPGKMHFLRRMKEDLVDFDGETKLFKGRRATNISVPLTPLESEIYSEALDLVDRYFPQNSVPLARMVYGKRAASSLFALGETLRRRRDGMGTAMPTAAAIEADPDGDDPIRADEARIIVEGSRSSRAERKDIDSLLTRLDPLVLSEEFAVSKWSPLIDSCFGINGISPGNGEQAVVFTEYADTADWLVSKLKSSGFSARRYSGRDSHHVRDDTRDAFARKDFQVLVSTDAGNEGIDLQSSHVLVNYDIPWSLVRLEQRMGRIHRVGQEADVELFNLIATETREGNVLEVLLGNFVTAANQLDGRMFDSLSLVGELVGLPEEELEQVLAGTFGDAEQRSHAISAARAVTVSRIFAAAKNTDEQERALRSRVDVAQAVAALQSEHLERINPTIIEAFLRRAADGGAIKISPHGAGEGIYTLSLPDGSRLPDEFIGIGQNVAPYSAIVATSGQSLINARANNAAVPDAVALAPSDPAYKALIDICFDASFSSMFRGGQLIDETSASDYDLYAFEADLNEAGGKRKSVWSCLIRVDSAGARPVRWEILANLTAGKGTVGAPHPGRVHDAEQRCAMAADEEQARRTEALDAWLREAQRELDLLPNQLTNDITDRDLRIAERTRIRAATMQRMEDLRRMSEVSIDKARRIAWARVVASAIPPDVAEKDSERISMERVVATLRQEGFAVADVHSEGRGYDLHASKGREQRLIEVKGVWHSAGTQGITLTANEMLIAAQHRDAYWLYVVDECKDGEGTIYGTYPDPFNTFAGLSTDQVIVRVPGSALKYARDAEEFANADD